MRVTEMKPDAVALGRAIEALEETADQALIDDLRRIQRRITRQVPQTVEVAPLFPKSATIPDGWSWNDVNKDDGGRPRFKGFWSGVSLKKGEPTLWQAGHVLFVRQGDMLTERDYPYWRRVSRQPGQTVLVVFGYYGARQGYLTFENGEQTPWAPADSEDLAAWIVGWLTRAHENPLPDWNKAFEGF